MKFEVVESSGEWIVQHQGVEVARFEQQSQALIDVARRLGDAKVGDAGASLAMRYEPRIA